MVLGFRYFFERNMQMDEEIWLASLGRIYLVW